MSETPLGDDAVDDSSENDCCHHGVLYCDECRDCDDEEEQCLELGCDFDIVDGRCRVCGDHELPHPTREAGR